jgi:beta-mannosidase
MLVHQKAHEGNLRLERGLGDHLPLWKTDRGGGVGKESGIADWHWITQLNQARAVAYGIEHFRSLFPLNTGAVVWQLNDNWPVISWAAVDGHGIRKPLWFALRRVYADRLLTVQPREDGPVVAAHNDTDSVWSTSVTVSRRNTAAGGEVLAQETFALEVEPRSAVLSSLPASVAASSDPAAEYVEVRADDRSSTYWYFVEDTSLQLVRDAYTASVSPRDDGYDVTVTASALAKDLALFPDRLDPAARVDSCLITLSAGESHTFHVTAASTPDGPLGVPVLRSVNDLVG